ncbi:MAG: nucleotidyltransferase family protein [Betaproteobacteria bacterium]|nr:nucleotidyltransferase family protein [Betaproteobacteria bacterium]
MEALQPTLIVLGAGRGSRFHGLGHKLEQRVGAETVFALTLGHALATGLPLKVVTTEPLLPLVLPLVARRDVLVLPDPQTDPRLGMGYSIASGVRASLDSAGWLLLPADMPLIDAPTILRVAQELPRHTVVYAQHRGQRGHPVGFSAELASELMRLTGDEGARRLVARYPGHALDVDDAGVIQDFDTEADFRRLDNRALASGAA